MHDAYDDRTYQALRQDFHANLTAMAGAVGHAFDRLHARLYDAPWSMPAKGRPKTKLMVP